VRGESLGRDYQAAERVAGLGYWNDAVIHEDGDV
jgi:hypothetical protein